MRSCIVVFWIALIATALYLPKWKRLHDDKNTINIFVWGDILHSAVLDKFSKETGININLSYYSSNEELIVKMKATKGEGYDLIIPSDYAVHILRKEDLLKPLNKEKFAYWKELNPHLIHQYFDPENAYSIPFEWELYGLGINKNYFSSHPTPGSWKMIFDPKTMQDYKIAMNNDALESTAFAAYYLYGSTNLLTASQELAVLDLLIKQRPHVVAYVNFRGDYFLATKNAMVAVASSSYIFRARRYCDFVQFVIPEEGTFLTVENFCIPKPSEKEDLVFELINYLCSEESVRAHFDAYFLLPATTHAIDSLPLDDKEQKMARPSEKDFTNYHFVHNVLSEEQTRDLWVKVKS